MARIDPHRWPQYGPCERMAILELKAARGWSQARTAEVFQVTAATIGSWLSRVDDEGLQALVRQREPVNRFPKFVRYVVGRLKPLCPRLGTLDVTFLAGRWHLPVVALKRAA